MVTRAVTEGDRKRYILHTCIRGLKGRKQPRKGFCKGMPFRSSSVITQAGAGTQNWKCDHAIGSLVKEVRHDVADGAGMGGVMGARPCAATRADGTPCRALALATGPYCWAHEPGLQEKRREVRAKGGKNSATSRRLFRLAPPELRETLQRLLGALEEVHAGRLDPRRATAMAAVARAVASIYEQSELAARVHQLEEQVLARGRT